MKFSAILFVLFASQLTLVDLGGPKKTGAGPSDTKTSTTEKSYRFFYTPNAVLHDIYFKKAATGRKVTEAFSTADGWVWHFTTALGDGKAKNNLVYQLEEKYPDKSSPEYVAERRKLENLLLTTLREKMYAETDRTLLQEMKDIYKPYKVYLDAKTILTEWEKQTSLTEIQNALRIEPQESEEAYREKIAAKISDTLSATDEPMTLEDALIDLQRKLNIKADINPIAEELKLKSIVGQLFHEYRKAGSLSMEEFYIDIVSLTKALGGVELTSTKELKNENQRVKVQELMDKINQHFKEASEKVLTEDSRFGTLLKDFYAEHPGKLPFKLKVRQLLSNLLSLEEVELTLDPARNKLLPPELEKTGKPSAKPSAQKEIKEIVQLTSDIGQLEIAFVSVDPELKSIDMFYEANREQLENKQEVIKLQTEMEDALGIIKSAESKMLKKDKKMPEMEEVRKLKAKIDGNLRRLKMEDIKIDWTSKDKITFQKIKLKLNELEIERNEKNAATKRLFYEQAEKELESLQAQPEKDFEAIKKKIKSIDTAKSQYQSYLEAVENFKLEKTEIKKTLRTLEKTSTIHSETIINQGSVIRIDSTFGDGTEEPQPSTSHDSDISVPEEC